MEYEEEELGPIEEPVKQQALPTEKTTNEVNLGDKVVGEIELKTFDALQYIGRKVKIANVREFKGDFGYYIQVYSEPIDHIGEGDKSFDVIARKMFGLQEDKEGNIGWGAETKLGLFLKKHKVNHYKELVGKEIIVQCQTGKDNKDYLTFN